VAFSVARQHISPTAELVEISTPMTRDMAVLEAEWRRGAVIIADYLREGKTVAFITIGDAMLYSTYTYLMKQVKQLLPDVAVESIPGVTSFAAAAAHLNLALSEGIEKLAIIPAVDNLADLKSTLAGFPNVVIMKVAGKYSEIVDILDKMGLKNNAVYISKLGYSDQFITTDLDSIRDNKQDYLSLLLVKREGL
jgi:precorrin-2/cobalt-factor-2 C20-methyltransferase